MAFKLNVRNAAAEALNGHPRDTPRGGGRDQFDWSERFAYFASPRMHMMSALFAFMLGAGLIGMAQRSIAPATGYDMTATGSIAAKSPTMSGHSCE